MNAIQSGKEWTIEVDENEELLHADAHATKAKTNQKICTETDG